MTGDQSGRAVRGLRVDQSLVMNIYQSLAHELLMREIWVDAGTVLLGHTPAGLVFQVTPEKGPSPTNVWLVGMHGASLLGMEEDACPIGLGYDDRLFVFENHVLQEQRLRVEAQSRCQTTDVPGCEHDSALSLTALAAHAAGKDVGHNVCLYSEMIKSIP
jgi:hypothetical protein